MFQTLVVSEGLKALGYDVAEPTRPRSSSPTSRSGTATSPSTPRIGSRCTTAFWEEAGGDDRLQRVGTARAEQPPGLPDRQEDRRRHRHQVLRGAEGPGEGQALRHRRQRQGRPLRLRARLGLRARDRAPPRRLRPARHGRAQAGRLLRDHPRRDRAHQGGQADALLHLDAALGVGGAAARARR